jgi:hypothetical protein
MAGNGFSLKFWKKKQYVCFVRNNHSSGAVLVVAKPGDVKEKARGAGSVSFRVNANPTGGSGAVSRSTDNTYEWRPSMLWMKTIQVQQETCLRVRVPVYTLLFSFPKTLNDVDTTWPWAPT